MTMKTISLAALFTTLMIIGAGVSAADAAPKDKPHPEYLALGDSTTFGEGASNPSLAYVSLFHEFLDGKGGLKKGQDGVDLLNLSAPGECTICVFGQLAPALDELRSRNQDNEMRNDVKVITVTWGDWILFGLGDMLCEVLIPPLPYCGFNCSLTDPDSLAYHECAFAFHDTIDFSSEIFDYNLGQLRLAAGPETRIFVMTSYNALISEGCDPGGAHLWAPLWDIYLEGDSSLGPSFSQGLNDAFRASAAKYGAEVVEIYGLLGPSDLQPDCYNPNDSGHQLIAAQFERAWQSLKSKPRAEGTAVHLVTGGLFSRFLP